MAGRIRTLKPEWLEDELLAACEDHVRLLSVALILLADDHGRGRGGAVQIAAAVWGMASMSNDPHETLRKASGGLQELERIGFLTLYKVRKQQYFQINNWLKHQKVQRPSKPRVPTPDEADSPPPDPDPPEGCRTDPDPDPIPPTTDPRVRGDRSPSGQPPAEASADPPRLELVSIDPTQVHEAYATRWRARLPTLALTGPERSSAWALVWEQLARAAETQAELVDEPPWRVLDRALDGFFADAWAIEKHFPPKALHTNFARYFEAGPTDDDRDEAAYERAFDELEEQHTLAVSCGDAERAAELRAEQDSLRRSFLARRAST
ncbi:MAG: hypothetical protein RLP09_09670 [Sandaracinaceae bacterium]